MLDQALEAFVSVTHILNRSTDERRMLEDVCRLMAGGKIGFRLVWIGFADNDAGRTVRSVACAGVTEYLDGLDISWNPDVESGRGPSGEAVRTGEPQVVRSALEDDRYRLWAERAARFGINSSCAVPFDISGTRGLINVYAAEVDRFTQRGVAIIQEVADNLGAAIMRIRRESAYEGSLRTTIGALSAAIEARDPFTAGHQRRVASLARAIADAVGLTPHEEEGLYLAGTVHDIGKLAVPVEILTTIELSALGYEIIKTHSTRGREILNGIQFPYPLATWVFQHHERLDGSGYPLHLQGDAILPGSRILAVADVVESMASFRPYRPTNGVVPALAEVEHNAGRLYDGDVVAACARIVREGWDEFAPDPPYKLSWRSA